MRSVLPNLSLSNKHQSQQEMHTMSMSVCIPFHVRLTGSRLMRYEIAPREHTDSVRRERRENSTLIMRLWLVFVQLCAYMDSDINVASNDFDAKDDTAPHRNHS